MEEHQTLYCFKLKKETGEIKKIEITNYERGKWTGNKSFYRFRIGSNIFYAYDKELDRFKNDRMYSLNPSMEHAVTEILSKLKSKRDIAKREYEKWKKLINNVNFCIELEDKT